MLAYFYDMTHNDDDNCIKYMNFKKSKFMSCELIVTESHKM